MLTEANKAAPTGQLEANRTPTQVTQEFLRNVVTIEFDRNIKDGKYQQKRTFLFQSSVDQYGNAKALKIKCRNTYAGIDYGDATEVLSTHLVSNLLPTWGKPMYRLRRSVDMSMYLDVSPGDIVLLTDSFVRDPSTGERGITTKPALIISHSFAVTGQMMGEVDLLIQEFDDVVQYCPTATSTAL